jgi:Raf kinase inhibitor-like YbhB/YbcL family protein
MSTLRISSKAFLQNSPIPPRYTCDGSDVNPPLVVENVSSAAKSLVLIVDDPDAPGRTWVHWVVWNISADTKEIHENSLPASAQEGMNDFRKRGYGGPCPPAGTHRYFFKLYALDTMLELGQNTTKSALELAMKGHVVGQAELVGTYTRR